MINHMMMNDKIKEDRHGKTKSSSTEKSNGNIAI